MKNKIKITLSFILGITATLTVVVYASETLFNSKDISYTNESTEVNNVSDAVNELYDKSLSEIDSLKSEKADLIALKNNIIESYKKGELNYLSEVVAVGDYVAYDAGTWTESKERPTSQGQFGGYTAGKNKANSVECSASASLKGWQVFSIDKCTKTVTLIHAGQSECYYHQSGYGEESVTNLNNRATSVYLNSAYAQSTHMMNKEEYDKSILSNTGSYYWLASYTNIYLWRVNPDGSPVPSHNGSNGIRPIVVLKTNILTTGKGTDMVGQEAWTLVKP